MSRIYTFILLLVVAPFFLIADTYPEVVFDNSIMRGSYAHSKVSYEGSSWIENVQGYLPVSDTLFFTPGNALSLKYTSAAGSWKSEIYYTGRTSGYQVEKDAVLAMKLYVLTAESTPDNMPDVAIVLADSSVSRSVNLSKYIGEYASNSWLSVNIPIKDFGASVTASLIKTIRLSQNHRDKGTHHMLLDQIEFLPQDPPSVKLFSPAVLSAVKAYERHVDLTWELPLTPSIRYIKIYRSEDNENFEPVSIKPIFVRNATDIVPESNKTYYYKITWVDYQYVESPFSVVKKADAKSMTDDELLDVIQTAHINYFIANAEVNSGMHVVSLHANDSHVSVKNTGLSILAQLVGVDRGVVSRSLVLSRLHRILAFLGNAERHKGVFPEVLNGRTGTGVYAADTLARVDLVATSSLMQGLLVAKQYYDGEHPDEVKLREKIDSFWSQVEWNHFVVTDDLGTFLVDSWSPGDGLSSSRPLGGSEDSFIPYLLALSSPSHAIQEESYRTGLGYKRVLSDSVVQEAPVNNSFFAVTINTEEQVLPSDSLAAVDTVLSPNPVYEYTSYRRDTVLYGLSVGLGTIDTSLTVAMLPFIAFDPRNKQDQYVNYFENHLNLMQAYKRRDNEWQQDDFSLDIWGSERLTDESGKEQQGINPAISVASYAYMPDEALKSIRGLYSRYGEYLFTEHGFRPWINVVNNKVSDAFDPVNQALVAVMIENGRSGLIWNLFLKHPDIDAGSRKVFEYLNVDVAEVAQ